MTTMSRTHRFARRSLLRGIGLGGLGTLGGAGFLPWFAGRSEAQAASAPLRFVVFFTPNEPIEERYWKPTGASGNEFSLSSATLPAPIDELSGVTDHLLLLGNLRMSNPGYDHAAIGVLLTGRPNDYPTGDKHQNAAIGSGISIDQYIADALDEPALVLGVRSGSTNGTTRLSYRGARRPVSPYDDPQEAFQLVFGDALVPDEEALARARRLAQRRSVLDAASGQLRALETRLGAEDRQHLAHHLEELRALERQMGGSDLTACEPLDPGATDFRQAAGAVNTARLQMNVLTEALRCRARRVGVLQLGHSGDMFSATMRSPDHQMNLGSRHEHVDLAHGWQSYVSDRVLLERVYYALFREFLEKLAATPDGEGASLLDNTVVLWCKSLAYRHNTNNMLFMLAGGKNSGIGKFGRYVDGQNRWHNDLLVACLQLMGLPDTSFGSAEWNSGALQV